MLGAPDHKTTQAVQWSVLIMSIVFGHVSAAGRQRAIVERIGCREIENFLSGFMGRGFWLRTPVRDCRRPGHPAALPSSRIGERRASAIGTAAATHTATTVALRARSTASPSAPTAMGAAVPAPVVTV